MAQRQIRSSAQQSMHLIIPDKADSSVTTTPARGQSPASAPRSQGPVNQAHQYFDSILQQRARHMDRGMSNPTTASHALGQTPTGTQSAPGMATGSDHYYHQPATTPFGAHPAAPQMYRGQPTPAQYTAQGFQQMAHRLSREAALHRAYLNQWDRTGGIPGVRPTQPRATSPLEAAQRRPSPAPSHDGYPTPESLHQRFRGTGADSGLSDAEVQNILRGADARQAILTMTNAMQRSASGTSLAPASGRATPNPSYSVPHGLGVMSAPNLSSPSAQTSPDVYILYSPTGPRGLLINSHTSETYYTPPARITSYSSSLGLPNLPTFRPTPVQAGTPADQPTAGAEQAERNFEDQEDPHARLRRRVRVRIGQPAAEAGPAHPNHHGAAAFIARIWPHFWLAFRLGLFVWWFTSPSSSWSRWAAVIAIAIAIFVLNTGALDGFADSAWRVICRHMEDLIPMTHQNRAAAEANQNLNQEPPRGGPHDEPPRPANMAARLVGERRRGNATWLLDQVRRAERAGLLFLASIAPGVAERHIANLEAEVERQRREAEAAEEEARRAEEEARRAAEEGSDANAEAGENAGRDADGDGDRDGTGNGDARPPSPPPPAPAEVPPL